MLRYNILFTIALLAHLVTSSSANYFNLSGENRMGDPKLRDCLSRCPVTLDLDPQCASDGNSYPNISSVRCMQKCLKPYGEELTAVYTGYCMKDIIGSV